MGRAVRRFRRAHRLTIEDLAALAEVHPTYLGRVERGCTSPTWGRIVRLAWALDMDAAELARHAEDESQIARITGAARARLEAECEDRS